MRTGPYWRRPPRGSAPVSPSRLRTNPAIKLERMSFPQRYKSELIQAIDSIDLNSVQEAIEVLRRAREEGRRIFTCGNGGSASTASHFVCDIVKGASFGREKRFKIIALTDALSTLHAYSNDV